MKRLSAPQWENIKETFRPQRRIARLTLVGAVLYVLGLIIDRAFPDSLFGFVHNLGVILLLAGGVYYMFGAFLWLQRKLLWKVRNKLIVSYAFVGIVPLALLLVMIWLGAKLVFGQLGAVYLSSEIDRITDELEELNVALHLTQPRAEQKAFLSDALYERAIPADIRSRYADLEFHVFVEHEGKYAPLSLSEEKQLPAWIPRPRWRGVVMDNGAVYLRSVCFRESPLGNYATEFSLPLSQSTIDLLQQRTGIQILPLQLKIPAGSAARKPHLELEKSQSEQTSAFLSDAGSKLALRGIAWPSLLQSIDWQTGKNPLNVKGVVVLVSSFWNIYNHYFYDTGDFGRLILLVLGLVGAVCLVVEAFSVLLGLLIARSITASVHHLSSGAQSILVGDFGYRIKTRNRDELDHLGQTFNQMSASMQQLLLEVAEKERLEKEIEIAREVQAQLFPRYIPKTSGLELSGTCIPARTVSGDYYDFVAHSATVIDVIVSDISGKGISAALLMANLQSTIRSQASISRLKGEFSGGRADGADVCSIVQMINRQLYENTSPEKYATLFYGRYNSETCSLTYCNAGHNPPLLFNDGSVKRLEAGGTVVGLFDSSSYEQSQLILNRGNVLVFYTDGLTEAEDPHGEEFGEKRLVELIAANRSLSAEKLRLLLSDTVQGWTAGGEQYDDITIVVARVR
ncbi:MAG TPA: SpoIIE family protein phosphatase [Acidobacteriota bacterium]|jgi:sigma-B regulation protein RsbU (phosphoserine phosphatase)|nr:SpoIIE family protein phosphatase [Acidobacteriota bacterium]